MTDLDVHNDEKYTNLAVAIATWVETTHGYFSNGEVDSQFKLTDRRLKKNRWEILDRLVDRHFLEKHPRVNGRFRKIVIEKETIDWKAANAEAFLPLQWPFRLENLVKVYAKNIAVIAGEPNSGKTAFCFDFIKRNMGNFDIDYYSSEMGAEEMRDRLEDHPIPLENWRFESIERTTNFADVIHPDHVSVIDYIELLKDVYLVGQEIFNLWDKVRGGFILVAIQKKKGQDLGRGAEFGTEKPRLYLSMSPGKLKIIKAKKWADPQRNPNGMEIEFKLRGGWEFIYDDPVEEWKHDIDGIGRRVVRYE